MDIMRLVIHLCGVFLHDEKQSKRWMIGEVSSRSQFTLHCCLCVPQTYRISKYFVSLSVWVPYRNIGGVCVQGPIVS